MERCSHCPSNGSSSWNGFFCSWLLLLALLLERESPSPQFTSPNAAMLRSSIFLFTIQMTAAMMITTTTTTPAAMPTISRIHQYFWIQVSSLLDASVARRTP
jgi:hypothetical protein